MSDIVVRLCIAISQSIGMPGVLKTQQLMNLQLKVLKKPISLNRAVGRPALRHLRKC